MSSSIRLSGRVSERVTGAAPHVQADGRGWLWMSLLPLPSAWYPQCCRSAHQSHHLPQYMFVMLGIRARRGRAFNSAFIKISAINYVVLTSCYFPLEMKQPVIFIGLNVFFVQVCVSFFTLASLSVVVAIDCYHS